MDIVEANLESLGLDLDNVPPCIDLLNLDWLGLLRKLFTIKVTTKQSDKALDKENSRDAPICVDAVLISTTIWLSIMVTFILWSLTHRCTVQHRI